MFYEEKSLVGLNPDLIIILDLAGPDFPLSEKIKIALRQNLQFWDPQGIFFCGSLEWHLGMDVQKGKQEKALLRGPTKNGTIIIITQNSMF